MPKKQTGFALMDKELAKTISAKGGKAAHMRGTAHHFTHDEAVAAALKGVAKRRAAKMNNEG
ncbi:MAG: general stress protein [Candidatus Micrarchaeota archaeon]|nr:general stress protein [Candidatus Micrarchaeota archaeon]